MSIVTGKPKNKPAQAPAPADEKKALEFINNGGSIAPGNEQPTVAKEQEKGFTLRVEASLLSELDAYLKALPKHARPTRNAYIVQAMAEKLAREKQQ